MEYITIAKLNKTFGLKGEFRAYSLTDFPKKRFVVGKKYMLVNEKTKDTKEVTLKSFRFSAPWLVISFEEFPTINEAETYLGYDVNMDKAEATLPKDTYHIADLLGCEVYSAEGEKIGVVDDVFRFSSTYTLRVKRVDNKDVQIPFVNQFVPTVDLENKKIIVNVIPGLL